MSNEPKHTATPWIYRPNRHDDWGFIRDSEGDLVAVSKNTKISFSDYDGFRSRKQDPFEPNGKRIVQCVNACDGLDDPEKWIKQMKEYRVEMSNSSLSAEVNKRIKSQSELESLRAENAELIEALRNLLEATKNGMEIEFLYNAKKQAIRNLNKYENL